MKRITQMTDEEKNRAIAELNGWTDITVVSWPSPTSFLQGGIDKEGFYGSIPSYTTSLDAMHEVEKGMDHEDRREMRLHLEKVCYEEFEEKKYFTMSIAHATATQRATAYLLTKGYEL